MLRGKFIALDERSKINNRSFYLRILEKEEPIKSKVSRKLEQKSIKLKTGNQYRKNENKAGSLKRSIGVISL